ncbi:MAG: MarR family winged helix-turn-helix transcriptional regulator [Erysipelotrichaceae bacterium]
MPKLDKYASIINRISQRYFDETLLEYQIGCGQQFFLLHIYEMPGISQYDLSIVGHFDKSTTARAIKKLLELGYIKKEIDQNDQRINHLYTTELGNEVMQKVYKMLEDWHHILTKDLKKQEQQMAETLMNKLSINAINYIKRK